MPVEPAASVPAGAQQTSWDYGDAPEGVEAYPGVVGAFPTCRSSGPVGDLDLCGTPPIGTPPDSAGFVRHTAGSYWLGIDVVPWLPAVDFEVDGKVSVDGVQGCASGPPFPDCQEDAFGGDECCNDTDGGVPLNEHCRLNFNGCVMDSVQFTTTNRGPARTAYLNVLIDFNMDGDWNDASFCAWGFDCVYEWAVKNAAVTVPTGSATLTTPPFRLGTETPFSGDAWMRITLSDEPVSDDFPWRGSQGMAGGALAGGETEDYLVFLEGPSPICVPHRDLGDAPEGMVAYGTGVMGRFPTCAAGAPAGTQEEECDAPGSPPGPTGYVLHYATMGEMVLGCASGNNRGVDSEPAARVTSSLPPGSPASCEAHITGDCEQTVSGVAFGQDECFGSPEAGLTGPTGFAPGSTGWLAIRTSTCAAPMTGFLNVLVDWNGDGDWNDALLDLSGGCVREWVVRNLEVTVEGWCNTVFTPSFRVGSRIGDAWMRISLTNVPVLDDFPWNGSGSEPGHQFNFGETEDYMVRIGTGGTGIPETPPAAAMLAAPFPNPFARGTRVLLQLAESSDFSLNVFSIAGRHVRTLARGPRPAGGHEVEWDGRDESGRPVAAGVYVIRLEIGDRSVARRAVLIR